MEKFIKYMNAERGRQKYLAKTLGISQAAISQWTHVPAERIFAVSKITGLSVKELRPDLFTMGKEDA